MPHFRRLANCIESAKQAAGAFRLLGPVRVLGQSKNVTLLFAGSGLVGRVSSLDRLATLRREIAVARHLERCGAPAIRLARDLPPGPHVAGSHAVSFWRYAEPVASDEDEAAEAAAAMALDQVHAALKTFPEELPSYEAQIKSCRRQLLNHESLPAITPADRATLLAAHDLLMPNLIAEARPGIVLHGDAHLGNVCFTGQGPLWLDFEDVCRGPREWDVARFGAPQHFAGLDPALLARLAILRSVCVAVWCWKDPAKRDDALHHTALVQAWAAAR